MELGTPPIEWERPSSTQPVGLAGQGLQQAVFGSDSELYVKFFNHRILNEAETERRGVKCFDTKEFVKIQRMGEKLTVFMGEATLTHRRRFPAHYQHYKEGKSDNHGIPLEAWEYQLSESDVMTFKQMGIFFVHQLAAMSPAQQEALGLDSRRIVARAKIDTADTTVKDQAATLQRELDEMRAMFAKQQDENEQIKRLLEDRRDEREKEERRQEGLLGALAEGPAKDLAAIDALLLAKRKKAEQ